MLTVVAFWKCNADHAVKSRLSATLTISLSLGACKVDRWSTGHVLMLAARGVSASGPRPGQHVSKSGASTCGLGSATCVPGSFRRLMTLTSNTVFVRRCLLQGVRASTFTAARGDPRQSKKQRRLCNCASALARPGAAHRDSARSADDLAWPMVGSQFLR